MKIFNCKNKKLETKIKSGLIPAAKAREIVDKANNLKKLTKYDI
ncbi:hypothetical protein [Liquorilactobacillus hordei]